MPHLAIGRALVLVAALAAVGAGAQTMYKWVDEKGTTHFSQHPPPDATTEKKASKVTPKVQQPSGGAAYDPNAWKGKDAEARKRQIERGQQEQASAEDTAKRAQVCDRARSRLAFLQNTHIIYRDNPDGSRTFLEDKQRDAEIAKARQVADEACR
jgi:hypothetical protein